MRKAQVLLSHELDCAPVDSSGFGVGFELATALGSGHVSIIIDSVNLSASAIFKPRSELGRFVDVHITPAVRAAVEESCQVIEDAAKAMCPVDTGALRDSITHEVEELPKTIRGTVGPHTDYAVYVEFGTGVRGSSSPGAGPGPYSSTWPGMVAQPYMRPAADENREKVFDTFKVRVGEALK